MYSQHRTNRRRSTGILAAVLLMTALRGSAVPAPSRSRTSNSGSDVEDSDIHDAIALQQLTRVFGVESVSDYYHHRYSDEDGESQQSARHCHVRHRSPPDYMVQLYDTVAYTDGISKTAAPYEADVVRGIPDRGERTSIFVPLINVKRSILLADRTVTILSCRLSVCLRRCVLWRSGSV